MNNLFIVSRQRSIRIAGLLVVIVLSSSCSGGHNNKTEKRPNLLIIHTDEQSFRSISCYDNSWPDLETPNIDFLANNGARCEKFYTNHPVCTPSRTALLTGKYAQKGESYFNDIPLKSDALTFGDILKRHNYVTGYCGKLHLAGGPYPGIMPERKFGFDDNRYMFNNAHMKELTMNENGMMESPGGIGDEKTYTTDFLTDRCMEFIGKNKNKNWCYMISIPDPHDPNTERSPYDSMFSPGEMIIPPTFGLPQGTGQAWEPNLKSKNGQYHDPEKLSDVDFLKEHKALYYGMVKHIDDCVGRIIRHLEDNGLLDHTIIVYTTDHGDMMGEFSRYDKGVFYEASARIPFIMYFPTKIKSGTVIRQVISNIDFVPTILDLMDIPFGEEAFDGFSAAALFSGQADVDWQNEAFLSMPESVAVITGRYKLILRNRSQSWLIDLENDPEEMENAISKLENQDMVRLLALQLKDNLESNSDPNWTDSLTWIYDQRYYQHKQYREPFRQRATKRKVSWSDDLITQLNNLLK